MPSETTLCGRVSAEVKRSVFRRVSIGVEGIFDSMRICLKCIQPIIFHLNSFVNDVIG